MHKCEINPSPLNFFWVGLSGKFETSNAIILNTWMTEMTKFKKDLKKISTQRQKQWRRNSKNQPGTNQKSISRNSGHPHYSHLPALIWQKARENGFKTSKKRSDRPLRKGKKSKYKIKIQRLLIRCLVGATNTET